MRLPGGLAENGIVVVEAICRGRGVDAAITKPGANRLVARIQLNQGAVIAQAFTRPVLKQPDEVLAAAAVLAAAGGNIAGHKRRVDGGIGCSACVGGVGIRIGGRVPRGREEGDRVCNDGRGLPGIAARGGTSVRAAVGRRRAAGVVVTLDVDGVVGNNR